VELYLRSSTRLRGVVPLRKLLDDNTKVDLQERSCEDERPMKVPFCICSVEFSSSTVRYLFSKFVVT
jgi:hypothetical protein